MIYSVFFAFVICDLRTNMFKLTNLYRRMHNMKELKQHEALRLASELQANTMCKDHILTHNNPLENRTTLRDRLSFFNFRGVNIGENIAKQQNTDFKEVFKVWIKSELHKKNILGDYTYTNVATCKGRDGNRYWVQVFGKGYVTWDGSQNNLQNFIKENYLQDIDNNIPPDEARIGRVAEEYGDTQRGNNLDNEQQGVYDNPQEDNDYMQSVNRLPLKLRGSTKGKKASQKLNIECANSGKKDASTARDGDEGIVFLVKENENLDRVAKHIPTDFKLVYKGKYKKYIAIESSTEQKQLNANTFTRFTGTKNRDKTSKGSTADPDILDITTKRNGESKSSVASKTNLSTKASTTSKKEVDTLTTAIESKSKYVAGNFTNSQNNFTRTISDTISMLPDEKRSHGEIDKIVEEIISKLKTITVAETKDMSINPHTSIAPKAIESISMSLDSASVTQNKSSASVTPVSNSTMSSKDIESTSSTQLADDTCSTCYVTSKSTKIMTSSIDSSSNSSVANDSSTIPTCVKTVVKTIFDYKTVPKDSESSRQKTFSISYTKSISKEHKPDKNITVTVSLDNNKNIGELDGKLKKIVKGAISKYKGQESDDDSKFNEIIESFGSAKTGAEDVDIGEPLYLST